jgi:perosamine synthetase
MCPSPSLSDRPDDSRKDAASAPSVPLFHTHVSEAAIAKVNEVLRSGWLNEGAVTREFEAGLESDLGLCHPIAVNSGTSALHLALATAGISAGDEVVLPAQTFIATGTVVLMQGAKPVFADIDPTTGNLSPATFEAAITPRTRAVMPVHWGGYPCDMDEINAVAADHGIIVIEDAAHALGATYRGRPVGTLSRFTAFSFQAIKLMTTGDGGALCTLDAEDERNARALRWFGIDRSRPTRSPVGALSQDISQLGFKYQMNNVAAALGVGNLQDFPERLARRQAIAARYRDRLAGLPGLDLLRDDGDREPSHWLFTVLADRRENFMRRLAEHGIATSVIDFRIDRHSVFGTGPLSLPGQEAFEARQVAIPIHEGLSDAQVELVASTIRSGW